METDSETTFQVFFLQVCMKCIASNKMPEDKHTKVRVAQLYRYALTVLHQILLNPYAELLSALHLEDILIERLVQALGGPDPYIQVLLLDVVYASLKLREMTPVELPPHQRARTGR